MVDDVKVYTVNGANSGSSSSLPDWLTRKRTLSRKRTKKEHVETSLQLIQDFEFPEASVRIRTTRDGNHAIATGVYKPQMRVWDLHQLTQKFERHTDAENVDFVILSDDWTKTLHLQADRNLELHTQQGFHYRTRIPRAGRALAYHFPSCDAYVGCSGTEVYRLNLNEGRFMTPLVLTGDSSSPGEIEGVNAIDINPAHQLLAFGIDGAPLVEYWDPRSRTRAGLLRLPEAQIPLSMSSLTTSLSVTALSSRQDGLSMAVGSSSGYTLLYDLRSTKPFAIKDQGYGLPVKEVHWVERVAAGKIAGDGYVMSADKKVLKIWDRNDPSSNFASVTPSNDINAVHHIRGTGLIMLAHEGIELSTLYIPRLGPAAKWCSFLDNITEEMEDKSVRNVYEDYKFVERSELVKLGLDHLIGTPALKPYMHGYFLQLKLYDAARVITNPFAYEEHREKVLKEKLDKLADTRIRSAKKGEAVKVNKGLAAKLQRQEEKEAKKAEKKKRKEAEAAAADGEVDEEGPKSNLLNDPRFKEMFENPEFEIDEQNREFTLLNPSTTVMGATRKADVSDEEDEEMGSDSEEEEDDEEDDQGESDEESESEDSGDDLIPSKARGPEVPRKGRQFRQPKLVPMEVDIGADVFVNSTQRSRDRNASFGQRRQGGPRSSSNGKGKGREQFEDGGAEISWTPSSSKNSDSRFDSREQGGKKRQNVAFTLEKGDPQGNKPVLSESERRGRTHRRTNIRSGSKNAFRRT